MIAMTLLLLLVGAFYGWRYSKTDADPDWALFNLPAFTGSWYGRDFPDCKTPLVYLWNFAIAKIVGAQVPRVKFAQHFLVSLFGVLFYLLTGNFFVALAFVVLVNSGWLYAFHGNVGNVPAGLVLLSFVTPPWISAALLLTAVLYEPKLVLSALVLVAINGLYVPFGAFTAIGLVCIVILRLIWQQGFDWLIESNLVIPGRMQKNRKVAYPWAPWFTSNGMLYLLPWLIFAVYARPEPLYWLPAVLYFVLIGAGRVIRQNHLLPLVAWVAYAGIRPEFVLALVAVDWLSAGLYFGDIWSRFYIGLKQADAEAKDAGKQLAQYSGVLWANGLFSSIVYLYAGKPVPYGMTEQVEIREVTDRRAAMRQAYKAHPPDFVVETDAPAVAFNGQGYKLVGKGSITRIWRKV